jgi:hypothetical protein
MHTLFVSPDLESRLRFKQVARSTDTLASIYLSSTLGEALDRVRNIPGLGAIYVSSRFQRDFVTSFIGEAKRAPENRQSAYLVVMPGQQAEQQELAAYALGGADGFLMDPFSVESLNETIRVAKQVNKKRSSEQHEVAIDILLGTIVEHIDQAAATLRSGGAPSNSLKGLKQASETLHALPEGLRNYYLRRVPDFFAKARPFVPKARETKEPTSRIQKIRSRIKHV